MIFELHASFPIQTGLLRVNLADFPALSESRGSVRIATSPIDPGTKRQTGLFAPVIINRDDEGELHVLSAACMHEECIVRHLDLESNLMVCPCHGSQYQADGTVVHGPSMQSLIRFDFSQNGDVLNVEMPDVFYEMSVQKAAASSRLQISFLAFEALKYEIYFRHTLTSPPERVAFATSPTGPLDQTEIEIPGDFANVFVEPKKEFGFFQVAMKSFPV